MDCMSPLKLQEGPILSRLSAGWSEHPMCSGWVEAQSHLFIATAYDVAGMVVHEVCMVMHGGRAAHGGAGSQLRSCAWRPARGPRACALRLVLRHSVHTPSDRVTWIGTPSRKIHNHAW